jgi:hypothetical protein
MFLPYDSVLTSKIQKHSRHQAIFFVLAVSCLLKMPNAESLWSQIDLSRTKSSLLKLEQDCVCSGCQVLPPKPR